MSFWKKAKTGFFVVIYENGADLAGLLIAAAGIFLRNYFQNPLIDDIASILIGSVLALVAIILIMDSRNLLIGESAKTYMLKAVNDLVINDPDVASRTPLTMQMSPDEVLLALDVEFRTNMNGTEMVKAINRLESQIRNKFPEIKHLFVEAGNLSAEKNKIINDGKKIHSYGGILSKDELINIVSFLVSQKYFF